MIYIDDGHQWNPDHDDHPPMSGTRIGHEVVSENVIVIEIQHAKQTFRGDRRSLTMIGLLYDQEPEPGDDLFEELIDWGHKTAGRRPLTRPEMVR